MWEIREFLRVGKSLGFKKVVENGFLTEMEALKRKFELEKTTSEILSVFRSEEKSTIKTPSGEKGK